MKPDEKRDYQKALGRHICKCECGGIVRGVRDFDRLWTWCEKCTPVVKFTVNGGEPNG